jgi:hypothetical protein
MVAVRAEIQSLRHLLRGDAPARPDDLSSCTPRSLPPVRGPQN